MDAFRGRKLKNGSDGRAVTSGTSGLLQNRVSALCRFDAAVYDFSGFASFSPDKTSA
jgi:hypothetical protein